MIEVGVTAGILGSAITPTSVALGGARRAAAVGDIAQPRGCCGVNDVFRWFVPTGLAAHIDRAKQSRSRSALPSEGRGRLTPLSLCYGTRLHERPTVEMK